MVLCTSLRMIYNYTAMLHERDDSARQYKSLRRFISSLPCLILCTVETLTPHLDLISFISFKASVDK